MIRLEEITKTLGREPACACELSILSRKVSLDIQRGEFVFLVGASWVWKVIAIANDAPRGKSLTAETYWF